MYDWTVWKLDSGEINFETMNMNKEAAYRKIRCVDKDRIRNLCRYLEKINYK